LRIVILGRGFQFAAEEPGVPIKRTSIHRIAPRVLWAMVAACVLVACDTPAPAATPDPLSGRYTASGGGGALPAMQALAARFHELHPRVDIVVAESGSNSAIKLLLAKTIDIGFVSRALTDAEKQQLTPVPIGFSGTAIVVNAANPITNVTKEQLRKIYGGEVLNWSEIGGPDARMRPYIREPNAATRQTFESFLFGSAPATYGKNVVEQVEVEALLTAVASFRGSIGIASTGSRTASDARVKILRVDGVAPTQENIASGTYQLVRPLFVIYETSATDMKPAVREFFEFVRSPEGQRIAAAAF
jgi:phosphate transport system substrate-binding protein